LVFLSKLNVGRSMFDVLKVSFPINLAIGLASGAAYMKGG
jgi:hypothetical protein